MSSRHMSISGISQLLLTRFWWNFTGRFLGTSRTDSNCHSDIYPGNICPGNICSGHNCIYVFELEKCLSFFKLVILRQKLIGTINRVLVWQVILTVHLTSSVPNKLIFPYLIFFISETLNNPSKPTTSSYINYSYRLTSSALIIFTLLVFHI